MEFVGIVKKVESKALASLDKSARITIETENLEILEVGKWPGDEMVKFTIERVPKS